MGCRELIESLKKTADFKMSEIENNANAEAEKVRSEYSARIEASRSETKKNAAARRIKILDDMAGEATLKARGERLSAERKLSDRLFEIAKMRLSRLSDSADNSFGILAAELPGLVWGRIRVNPRDEQHAKSLFANAEIQTDAGISGGLEAITVDGRITIVNTFEKRLERSWEEILPELMKEAADGVARKE
jgi:V/A-type H+/Na+-transporting ATPase subunit E